MKNKKLFAILTLLCFMMTLMPVAAFAGSDGYVWVDEDAEIVKIDAKGEAKVTLNMSATSSSVYVFAMADKTLSDNMTVDGKTGIVKVDGVSSPDTLTVTFDKQGEYTVYVVDAGKYENSVVVSPDKSETQKANTLLSNSDNKAIMENNVITVKPYSTTYRLTASVDGVNFYAEDYKDGDKTFATEVEAKLATLSNGADEATLWVKLENQNQANKWTAVNAQPLKISTNSYAIEASKAEVNTNPKGIAKFDLSSTIAGDYKLYVNYGTKADLTINVSATATDAAVIKTVGEPTAPIALDTEISKSDIAFTIADINGNNVKSIAQDDPDTSKVDEAGYYVKVVDAPKASSLKGSNITLGYDPDSATWFLQGVDLDEEGDYTFKVILKNGASATAKVTVKEFQTPVELKMEYKQNAVELNGEALLHKLYYVDANGVTKSLVTKKDGAVTKIEEVKVIANGYAVDGFEPTTGKVTVKDDEKYVGSKINVAAVSQKYNLTTTVELIVANEASSVKYADTKADVAVNNTLVANIVDQDGNKVALKSGIKNINVSYVVLDKPENAKVALSTVSEQLAAKGQFKVSFTASEIGTYKVQTVVTYEQVDGVVKYYSGIEEITVGNTGFEDVVVMSIGSNEIIVNAAKATLDAAPMIQNDRTYVPFRALAEAFGAKVAYDEATQAVTAELNGVTVVMTIGSATYTINGTEKTMDVAPFINGSRTMIPVRFAAEAFGITVTPTYDENGATADVLFAK